MPDVSITIGGKSFAVSCQEGEEHYLTSAAAMLDAEATALTGQIGGLPEARMLLMSGLMLADKTAGMEDQLKVERERVASLEAQLASGGGSGGEPERIEVPVVPESVTDALAGLAAQAEALADQVEGKSGD